MNIHSHPVVIQLRRAYMLQQWPAVVRRAGARLDRAALIATTPGAIQPTSSPRIVRVQSERKPGEYYLVDIDQHTCTCPDHLAHSALGIICKHRLAVALAAGWVEESAPRTVYALINDAELIGPLRFSSEPYTLGGPVRWVEVQAIDGRPFHTPAGAPSDRRAVPLTWLVVV